MDAEDRQAMRAMGGEAVRGIVAGVSLWFILFAGLFVAQHYCGAQFQRCIPGAVAPAIGER